MRDARACMLHSMHTWRACHIACAANETYPSEKATTVLHEGLMQLHVQVLHLVSILHGLQPGVQALLRSLHMDLQVMLLPQDERLPLQESSPQQKQILQLLLRQLQVLLQAMTCLSLG